MERAPTSRRHTAFTIVELLVVMGIIILLLSILIVAVQAATRTAQGANTRTLMNSIKQALVRFEQDIGYLPPVLGDDDPTVIDPADHDLRKLFDPRGEDLTWGNSDDILSHGPGGDPNSMYRENIQEWYSITSLAEYLIGYGHHYQDGYGHQPDASFPLSWESERPPLGLRHPRSDGVWRASRVDGSLGDRASSFGSETAPTSFDQGQVYGPYLELRDPRLLASATLDDENNLVLSFPGEGDYDPDDPKVIVDYWGEPIRYYRRLYAPGSLESLYRPSPSGVSTTLSVAPSLSDVFLLRPFEIEEGAAINAPDPTDPDDSLFDDAEDPSTTAQLSSARFALFSPGPDRVFDPTARYDAEDYNKDGFDFSNQDNVVELSP